MVAKASAVACIVSNRKLPCSTTKLDGLNKGAFIESLVCIMIAENSGIGRCSSSESAYPKVSRVCVQTAKSSADAFARVVSAGLSPEATFEKVRAVSFQCFA